MKRVLLLLPLSLFATTGDNILGAGAKSRAVAGAGIAFYEGAESIFINPALLTQTKNSNFEAGTTFFIPQVTANGTKSEADFELIPYLGYTKSLEDGALGIGLFSVSGMGVDYRKPSLAFMQTKFAYAKLIAAYAKKWENLSIGVGLNLSYGKLEMAAQMPAQLGDNPDTSIGVGINTGISYSLQNFSFGAVYTSSVAMTYKGVFDFNRDGKKEDFHLTQPAEAGVGISYRMRGWEMLADAKRIFWHRARGYSDFGWKDQNVYSVGLQKKLQSTTLKVGYSYATKVMDRFHVATIEGAPFRAQDIAFFNLVGFPAITQRHISAGISFDLKPWRIHLAALYAPKKSLSAYGIKAKNRQSSLTIGVEYGF